MNIKEMTSNLQELVADPEKAAVIFKAILKSENPDIIQRALELYVLLILNHGDEITKALNEDHDKEERYEQIIRKLERQIEELKDKFDYDYTKTKEDQFDYRYIEELIKDLK